MLLKNIYFQFELSNPIFNSDPLEIHSVLVFKVGFKLILDNHLNKAEHAVHFYVAGVWGQGAWVWL